MCAQPRHGGRPLLRSAYKRRVFEQFTQGKCIIGFALKQQVKPSLGGREELSWKITSHIVEA